MRGGFSGISLFECMILFISIFLESRLSPGLFRTLFHFAICSYVNISDQATQHQVDNVLAALSLLQHPWYSRMNFFLVNNTILEDLSAINITDFMLKVKKKSSVKETIIFKTLNKSCVVEW